MELSKTNACNINKKNFNNVLWLPTGECAYDNTNDNKPINYIQLDKKRLKAPYHDLTGGFNCTLKYTKNDDIYDLYRIRSIDGYLLNVDHINNRLYFANNDKSIPTVKNMTDIILISGSYIFKCNLIKTQTTEFVNNKDAVFISVISVFEKDSSSNVCFSKYQESNVVNKYTKFVSFNENFEVNMSDSPTLFIIENSNDLVENGLKYGDIMLVPYRHPKSHAITGTITPVILPFAKNI